MRIYGITRELKLKQTRRSGQSSLEYMMTYGWIFLIAGLAIAILFYMGILNFSAFASSGTTISGFSSNVAVSSAYANSTETAVVVLNSGKSKINLSSVVFNVNGGNNSMTCGYSSLYPGQQTICYALASLKSPVYMTVYITYSYLNGLVAQSAVSSGNIFMTIASGNIPLQAVETITIFTESGLPAGTRWYATFGSSSLNSTSGSITFYDGPGNHAYSIRNVGNQSGICNTTNVPSISAGTLKAGSSLNIAFSKTYTLCTLNVTLSNTQSQSTANPFQQLFVFNASAYQNYEAANLDNIFFKLKNSSVIPSWLESGNSRTSKRAVYWLKLPYIAANSNMTIYLVLNMSMSNEFNAVNTGEAPYLSTPYGEYDDGANVFNFYDNFAGSSLNTTKWTGHGSNGSSGSLSGININNGLELTGGGHDLGDNFNTWLYSKTPASELTSNLTADVYEKGNSASGIFVPPTVAATSTSTSMSLTNPYGYDLYLCAGANGADASPYPGLSSVSWSVDEQDAAGPYSSIGHQTGQTCSESTTGGGPDLALAGIGIDNATSYTTYKSASGSGGSSSVSLTYTVSVPNSFVVIMASSGYYGLSSVTIPSGCTQEQLVTGADGYESAYIAVCPSQAANNYGVTATLSNTGGGSIVAYVFLPGNPNTFRWGFTDTAPTTWLRVGNGAGMTDLYNLTRCSDNTKSGSTTSVCVHPYTGGEFNNYSISFTTNGVRYYLNNYTSPKTTLASNIPSLSSSIGLSLSNEMSKSVNISWVRIRNTPPNGVMPSQNITT